MKKVLPSIPYASSAEVCVATNEDVALFLAHSSECAFSFIIFKYVVKEVMYYGIDEMS